MRRVFCARPRSSKAFHQPKQMRRLVAISSFLWPDCSDKPNSKNNNSEGHNASKNNIRRNLSSYDFGHGVHPVGAAGCT